MHVELCANCGNPLPCECSREGMRPKARQRWRSRWYMAYLHTLPCSVPGCCRGPIEAAHFGRRGVGEKVHDFLAIPLCQYHHWESHDRGHDWEYDDQVAKWQLQTIGAALVKVSALPRIQDIMECFDA